jgi:hypothetical protein
VVGVAFAKLKLFIETHGCQMNEYDSAQDGRRAGRDRGLELTDNAEEADVILVNTCSIREKAQEKVFSQLGRWKSLKQERRKARADRRRRLRGRRRKARPSSSARPTSTWCSARRPCTACRN